MLLFLIQMLTDLDISRNQIGSLGIRYLSNALEVNTVRIIPFLPNFILLFLSSIQVLTILNLDHNQFGSKGAQILSTALGVNNVRNKLLSSFKLLSFFFHTDTQSIKTQLV
jgi:hypothetical protein